MYQHLTKLLITVFKILPILAMTVSLPADSHIVQLSPQNGAAVTITNDITQNWWDHYKRNSGIKMAAYKDTSRPEPVILRWKNEASSSSDYRVYLSRDPDFKSFQCFSTAKTSLPLYNLYRGQQYYWKVQTIHPENPVISQTGTFFTKDCARTIWIKGSHNTRDLGGYKTSSGKTVKQGLVYRSGNFDHIKIEGKKTIRLLGIKTQLDIRKDGEGKYGHKTLPVKKYVSIKGYSYDTVFNDKESLRKTVAIMRVFSKPKNYPIVFHCIYGKDRTGTISFLLNGMLGVNKRNLYRDYELTYLSKHCGKDPKEKMKKFNKFYKRMRNYKNPSKPLSYNIKAFLKDNGMTSKEIHNIEKIMLE